MTLSLAGNLQGMGKGNRLTKKRDRGVMNVTSKPFTQLTIMHDRIRQKRPIKDCHKLFINEYFWAHIYSLRKNNGYSNSITIEQVKDIYKRPSAINEISSAQLLALIDACCFFIENVFVGSVLKDYKISSISDGVAAFKTKWLDVKWILKIKSKAKLDDQLFKLLDTYIIGTRFKQFLFNVLKLLKIKNDKRYQELVRDVDLTLHIIDQVRPFMKITAMQILMDDEYIYLGLNTSKQQAFIIQKRLHPFIHNEDDYYFKHFSRPMLFNHYQIKRNWQLKKICIEVPQHMVSDCAHMFRYGDYQNQKPKARGNLIHQSISKIYSVYQHELFQIASSFYQADNYESLSNLFYFAHLSFVKTIALKFNCPMARANKYLKDLHIERYRLPHKSMIRSTLHKQMLAGEPYTLKGVRTVLREAKRITTSR